MSLSAPIRASIESTAACLFSRSGVTAPIADPFLGLEGRNPRDRKVYAPGRFLDQIFVCFIFGDVKHQRSAAAQLSFLPRLCILFSAKRNLSIRLSCDAERCVRVSAAHFDRSEERRVGKECRSRWSP